MSIRFGLHFSCSSTTGGDWVHLYRSAIEQAKLAESLGFSTAVVAEHHFREDGWIPSPFLLCSAIAAVTESLRVGTDIVILPLHNPIYTTEDLLVLDNLSNGRAICGVGMGGFKHDFDVLGVPFNERVSRSEEAMELIQRLLGEENVSHAGRHFSVHNLTITPRSVQKPRIPIWYGGISEPGARRAARLADALVMGPGPDLAKLVRMRTAYESELAQSNRRPADGEIVLRREAYISESSTRASAEGLPALKHQYSKIYTHFPPAGSDYDFREFSRDRFIVGDPEEVVEEILRYQSELGMTEILFRVQLPGLDQGQVTNAIRLLGERVLPRVA